MDRDRIIEDTPGAFFIAYTNEFLVITLLSRGATSSKILIGASSIVRAGQFYLRTILVIFLKKIIVLMC